MGGHSQAAVSEKQRIAAVQYYAEQMVAAAAALGVVVVVDRVVNPLTGESLPRIDVRMAQEHKRPKDKPLRGG